MGTKNKVGGEDDEVTCRKELNQKRREERKLKQQQAARERQQRARNKPSSGLGAVKN